MAHGCVWIIDATGTSVVGSIETGVGAHGIYPSRDATRVYVSTRGRTEGDTGPSHDGQGSISVIDPATDQVVDTWQIPGGGSPDMGGATCFRARRGSLVNGVWVRSTFGKLRGFWPMCEPAIIGV